MTPFGIHVDAPADKIFALMSDFPNAPDRISSIKRIEMLTSGPVGVGTKFKETRVMFGKEATETMEVVEFVPPKTYTLFSLSCGVEFTVKLRCVPEGSGSNLSWECETKPVTLVGKLFSPIGKLMMGMMMKKCVMKDLADIKRVAEGK